MLKRIIVILFALLLSLPFGVEADHYPLDPKEWTVTFDGKSLKTNYTSGEIAESIKGMQPGDTADLSVTLINNYTEKTTWWIGNTIIESFEDNSKASGGAYRYSLSYTDASGTTTVLYSSNKVGGTGSATGLHEATDALDEMFVLGDIEAGERATVTIHIDLDGEIQGNSYQDTIGEPRLNFAVELPSNIIYHIPKTGTLAGSDMVRTRNLYYIACGILFIIMMILATVLYLNNRRRRTHS